MPPREIIGPGGGTFTVYETDDLPDAPPPAPDDYEWTAGDAGGGTQPPSGRGAETISASPYRWIEPAEIEPRQWLHGRHFIRKFLSATVSAGGIGKSSLELLDAVSMACGRDLVTGKPIEPRSCWYWNGEDPLEELQRRVQAITLSYDLTDADFGGRLYLDSGRAQRIRVASDDRRHGIMINRTLLDSMAATLQDNRIDALILDPFVSTHAVPENDNGAIDQVAKELAAIAETANCAVEVVHHVRKTNGAELTADDARGAVALIGAARSVRVLNPDEPGRSGEGRHRRSTSAGLYFRVDNGKANLAPPADNASWRQLVSVGLGQPARSLSPRTRLAW